MQKERYSETRTCTRCGHRQDSDQFPFSGLICFTCREKARDRRDMMRSFKLTPEEIEHIRQRRAK